MPFESFEVFNTYRFVSNSRQVLGQTVKDADATAASLDRLTEAFDRSATASARFLGASEELRAAQGSVTRGFAEMGAASASATDRMVVGNTTIARSFGNVARSASLAQVSMDRAYASSNRVARPGGGGGTGAWGALGSIAGIGALATTAIGIGGAANLQNSTLQAAIATGKFGPTLSATMANMRPTVAMAYKMSAITGGSVGDMMTVVQNMASSGLTSKQLTLLSKPIAQFTDILHYDTKNALSFGDAATLGASILHSLQLFSTSDAHYGLGRIAQLGYQSPHGTTALATQIRMFAPLFERMLPGSGRAKANQIVEYTAWMDRMGMLQQGGRGLNMLASYLINPRSKREVSAMTDLGLMSGRRNVYMNERAGTYNLPAALEHITRVYEASSDRGRVVRDVDSFSRNASRTLGSLTTSNAITALHNIRAQQKNMPGLDAMQRQVMETLPHAFGRLVTNVETLTTTLGAPLIQPLSRFVGALADATTAVTNFFLAHRTITNVAAAGLAGGSVFGAAKLFEMLGGVGMFVHAAAHHAKGNLGIGGYGYIRHHGGAAVSEAEHGAEAAARPGILSRVGAGLWDMASFGNLRRAGGRAIGSSLGQRALGGVGDFFLHFFPGIEHVGTALTRVGNIAGLSGRLLGVLGEGIFKIGARAIPVVGEVLLLIDTIKFLGAHAKDIGKGLGLAVHWIVKHGVPMLVDTFTGAVKFIVDGVKDTFLSLFNGGHGGFFGWFMDVVKSGVSSYQQADRDERNGGKKHPHSAANLSRGHGHEHRGGNVIPLHRPSGIHDGHVPASHNPQRVSMNGVKVYIMGDHGVSVDEMIDQLERHARRGTPANRTPGTESTHSGGTLAHGVWAV